jgi:hypothetical protein
MRAGKLTNGREQEVKNQDTGKTEGTWHLQKITKYRGGIVFKGELHYTLF